MSTGILVKCRKAVAVLPLTTSSNSRCPCVAMAIRSQRSRSAAAGPCLTYHLAAGDGGVNAFLQHLLASFEGWWGQLATWQRLEPEQQRALTHGVERAYKGKIEELREARDRRLSAILRALEQARTT